MGISEMPSKAVQLEITILDMFHEKWTLINHVTTGTR